MLAGELAEETLTGELPLDPIRLADDLEPHALHRPGRVERDHHLDGAIAALPEVSKNGADPPIAGQNAVELEIAFIRIESGANDALDDGTVSADRLQVGPVALRAGEERLDVRIRLPPDTDGGARLAREGEKRGQGKQQAQQQT